jgi:Cu(I)/Ag(I) efflux system membrane fusion protein
VSRALWSTVILATIVAAGTTGFVAGRHELPFVLPPALQFAWLKKLLPSLGAVATPQPVSSGPIIYYRDPDGPRYSLDPATTATGEPYVAVRASEDVRFDDGAAKETPAAAGSTNVSVAAQPPVSNDPKRIKYYRNPMGLPDTSPVPKRDSMGMDYIPVFTGDDEDGSTLKLSPGKLQRTGVRSEPAAMRTFATPVRASGTIQLDERRVSIIALRFDAYIDKVEDITTGTMVRQGQPLMHVYGPDLLAPAAQYLASNIEGSRRRLKNYDVPDSIIAQMDKTHQVPASFAWPAPRSGIVIERKAVDGMKANAGDTLFRLADISVVWVLADVAESDLPSIAVGQTATVKPRGSNRTFTGQIALIYPYINKETRTARVRIELPNPDAVLLPDMYAEVTIATGSAKPVLAVPDSAVIDSGDRQAVILDKGDGRLEPRDVKLGHRGDGYVEVTSGLGDGDRIVTGANFLIDAESNLKAALQGLNPPGDAK